MPHTDPALPPTTCANDPPSTDLTVRELAHELNSLLDGSLRCLMLASRSLDGSAAESGDPQTDALEKIAIARESMAQMATILERAMSGPAAAASLLTQDRPLGTEIQHLVDSRGPKATESGTHIEVEISSAAAELPIGPLGPVILNGLENALDACATSTNDVRRVELVATINGRRELVILIVDSGPGISDRWENGVSGTPGGHGIGLQLSQQLIRSVGGSLSLRNVPFGFGAILEIMVPVHRLRTS